jgi:hypothetical protein
VTIAVDKQNGRIETSVNQEVTRRSPAVNRGSATHHALHEFRWIETSSGGTAICSCGGWELRHRRPGALTQEAAKRDHAYHRANLPDRAGGHDGNDQEQVSGRPSRNH